MKSRIAAAGMAATAVGTLALIAANRLAPCPLTGDARPGTLEFSLNPQKNRTDVPTSLITVDPAAWLSRKADANAFPDGVGVQITGYVREVKSGGPESCGCHSTADLDIHIEVVPSASDAADRHKVVVVEVTPAFQHRNPDWTLTALRTSLKGRVATFRGWPFADLEHRQNSFADSPQNANDWRGTVYELHPVTAIQVQ